MNKELINEILDSIGLESINEKDGLADTYKVLSNKE